MKTSEIRDLPDEEIDVQVRKARAQLFKVRFHAANEEKQRAGDIRRLKRDIARYMTILRERQQVRGAGVGEGAGRAE